MRILAGRRNALRLVFPHQQRRWCAGCPSTGIAQTQQHDDTVEANSRLAHRIIRPRAPSLNSKGADGLVGEHASAIVHADPILAASLSQPPTAMATARDGDDGAGVTGPRVFESEPVYSQSVDAAVEAAADRLRFAAARQIADSQEERWRRDPRRKSMPILRGGFLPEENVEGDWRRMLAAMPRQSTQNQRAARPVALAEEDPSAGPSAMMSALAAAPNATASAAQDHQEGPQSAQRQKRTEGTSDHSTASSPRARELQPGVAAIREAVAAERVQRRRERLRDYQQRIGSSFRDTGEFAAVAALSDSRPYEFVIEKQTPEYAARKRMRRRRSLLERNYNRFMIVRAFKYAWYHAVKRMRERRGA